MATHETGEPSGDKPTEHLVQAYLDGALSETDQADLVARLTSDPAAADLFARATRFEALLESYLVDERNARAAVFDGTGAEPAGSGPRSARSQTAVVRPPLRTIARYAALATSLAAAVLIAWSIIAGRVPQGGGGIEAPIARAEHRVISGRVLVDGVEAGRFLDGARLEVAGDSEAVIRLADGQEIELSPAAGAVVDSSADEAIVRLDFGNARVRGDERRRLRIDTPAGVVSGRGAEFAVDVSSAGSDSPEGDDAGGASMGPNLSALLIVAVLTGHVEVSEADGKKVVPAGTTRAFSAEKKPVVTGRVIEVADDGRRITLEGKPGKPGARPQQREIKLTDATVAVYYGVPREGDRPTVGYQAVATLDKEAPDTAVSVEFGDKIPTFNGPVREVNPDGRSLQVEEFRKGDTPRMRTVAIDERTRMTYVGVDAAGERPTVGYQANIWLAEGSSGAAGSTSGSTDGAADRAVDIRFTFKAKGRAKTETANSEKSKSDKTRAEKPGADKSKIEKPKTDKPQADKPAPEKRASPKPAPAKPAPAKPAPAKTPDGKTGAKPAPAALVARPISSRDPRPVVEAIDRAIDGRLSAANQTAAPEADDAEFLRRATIDITGQIPSVATARAFLDDTAPDKRTKLVDGLLANPNYGRRFGSVWRRLIQPKPAAGGKPQTDRFTPWMADQLNAGRGWNEIVRELMTTEADLARDGRAYFLQVNSESFEPKPNLLAASTARLFLGVQLGCAECHDHPFAEWKQTEFWNLAAFYGRLHKRSKSDFTWTEEGSTAGAEITIPDNGGKAAGQVVPARFLGGKAPQGDARQPAGSQPVIPHFNGTTPLRGVLADWITARDNPYFARAAVNRLWAHFFGHGLVEPLDGFQADYTASHPEALDKLAAEFVAADYDLRHVIRIITSTRAYRRTSRPAAGKEPHAEQPAADLLARMNVKVLDADTLYDALTAAVNADLTTRGPQMIDASNGSSSTGSTAGKKMVKVSRPEPMSIGPRDEFVGFFRSAAGEAGPTNYAHGVPQLLRLMNADLLNVGTPAAKQAAASTATVDEKIEAMYLAALTRRPTDEQRKLIAEYVKEHGSSEQAWSDVFWMLVNSSEFLVNR
jgi:hypothetical protein